MLKVYLQAVISELSFVDEKYDIDLFVVKTFAMEAKVCRSFQGDIAGITRIDCLRIRSEKKLRPKRTVLL